MVSFKTRKAYDFKTSYGDSTFEKNDPEKEKYHSSVYMQYLKNLLILMKKM